MITTLLKHEFIRTRGMLAAIAGIGTLATAAGTVMTATGWIGVSQLGTMLAFIMIAIVVPALQFGLAFDFWNSSFRRTGYFTQTLPIKGSTIYWAKTLWGSLVTIVGLVINVLLLALFWTAFGPTVQSSRNFFADAGEVMSNMPTGVSIGIVLFLLVSYLGWLVQLYFAATLGSGKSLGRLSIGGPIIVYLVTYTVAQVVVMAGMLLIPFGLEVGLNGGNIGVTSVSFLELVNDSGADVIPLGFIPPLLLIFAVSIGWSVRNWNHKIALA